MKKFIFLLSFAVVFAVNAQTYTMKSVWGGSTDSVTNSGTNYLKTQINGLGQVTVQAVITKISGTGAGTAVLQGSLDGTNWVTINYVTSEIWGANSTGSPNDTFTLTNVTSQTVAWFLEDNQYVYYRVYVAGSGTELLRLSATAILRK